MKKLITTILILCVSVCLGEVKKPAIDLSGEWTGQNEELTYMNLNHEAGKITGKICEKKGHDCMVIKDAILKDNILTFHYDFKKKKKQIRVALKLLVSDDGNTLTGNAIIKKAGVNLKLTFKRSEQGVST